MRARAWLRRHLRAVAVGLALLAIGVALAIAITWHFSSFALVPNHSSYAEEVEVKAVTGSRIVLSRSEPSERPGSYGLAWQGGHAILGAIQAEGAETVTRELSDVEGYLVPGMDVGVESNVYAGTPSQARGLPYIAVDIADPLGRMPAWLIPAPHPKQNSVSVETWAIVVHGHNDNRQNGLRIAPTLRRAGLHSLLISYRNDLGAPDSPDGLYHLGETEWEDLEAAARYALRRGAQQLVLVGYSMGGALISQFMQRSDLADWVGGVVLDAPVLDWKSIFEFNAEQMGLPGFSALPVEWTIDARIDPDWNSLDALEHTDAFQLPVLLFHGREDSVVPIGDSDEFAEKLGKRVTYYRVPMADHTQEWNVDPPLYERRVSRFLLQIEPKTQRARPPGSGSKE
ncbi:MAG TPA: alpha/beta fold hydrolase [Solirubrobacterales bacterium]|nr:alpha/beta fold hydrolase [Solirubrobacterales bacterium]